MSMEYLDPNDWDCDCGEENCPECGISWAQKEKVKEVVVELPGGVKKYDDGSFEIPF